MLDEYVRAYMDKLKFKESVFKFTLGTYATAEIYINDRNIIDIIKEIELEGLLIDEIPKKDILAGQYAFLWPNALYNSLVIYDEFKTALMCPCGSPGCWDLDIQIEETDKNVYWYGFYQSFRPWWTYDRLAYFEFDKDQYYKQINKLQRIIKKYNPEALKYKEKLRKRIIAKNRSKNRRLKDINDNVI